MYKFFTAVVYIFLVKAHLSKVAAQNVIIGGVDVTQAFNKFAPCTISCFRQIPGFNNIPPLLCDIVNLCGGDAATVLTTCIPKTNCFVDAATLQTLPNLCTAALAMSDQCKAGGGGGSTNQTAKSGEVNPTGMKTQAVLPTTAPNVVTTTTTTTTTTTSKARPSRTPGPLSTCISDSGRTFQDMAKCGDRAQWTAPQQYDIVRMFWVPPVQPSVRNFSAVSSCFCTSNTMRNARSDDMMCNTDTTLQNAIITACASANTTLTLFNGATSMKHIYQNAQLLYVFIAMISLLIF